MNDLTICEEDNYPVGPGECPTCGKCEDEGPCECPAVLTLDDIRRMVLDAEYDPFAE